MANDAATTPVRVRIRQLIKASGLKDAAVAERMKEKPYWLSDRLTGRVDLKADELPRIATALGVTPCDFFSPSPEPEQSGDFTPTPGQRVTRRVLERMREWTDEELAEFDQFVAFKRWQQAQAQNT